MAKQKDSQQLHAMRHSLAHIMAAAIQKLWPDAKFGVGPVTDSGFYYDVDLGEYSLSPEDLPRIEDEMKQIIKSDLSFDQYDLPIDEAIEWAKKSNQVYKAELLTDFKAQGTTAASDLDDEAVIDASKSKVDKVSFYKTGDFEDLCRGPHVTSTKKVGGFRLHKIAGAYWRGDESKPMLTRIYGVAFATETEVDDYFKRLEEADKRDHRKLGAQLGLFVTSELVGSGLPLFTPKGTILRDLLNDYSQQLRAVRGFERVWIPHLAKRDLYKTSGHWDKFGDELFLVKSQETDDELILKPMNCPHHAQIYAHGQHSYRDLPVKYMETTTMYRDEKSGELQGLSRVRSISIDDCHAFCAQDQIVQVIEELIEAAQLMYEQLGLDLRFRLSFRDDSDAFLGDKKLWDKAQQSLKEAVEKEKLDYFIEEGEAAFYGPKIDFMATDSLGREWQLATVQLDFIQPQRFGLEYTDQNSNAATPVMVHAALLGSIERFLSIYIEHTGGAFPVWLAPVQVQLATVNEDEKIVDYARQLAEQMTEAGLRAEVDSDNETVGKKIRRAELAKVPYVLVIGEKEVKSGQLIPRVRDDIAVEHDEQPVSAESFIQTVVNESKMHVRKSSL